MRNEKFLNELYAVEEIVGRLPEGVRAFGVSFNSYWPADNEQHTLIHVDGDLAGYAKATGLQTVVEKDKPINDAVYDKTYARERDGILLLQMERENV